MGESDSYGLQFFINGKPIHYGDFGCGSITKPSPNDAERFAKVKAEMDAMAEKYNPIADKLFEEIYEGSQNVPMLPTSPSTYKLRKARKYYKPKFTL
jgi:hypothetical protein